MKKEIHLSNAPVMIKVQLEVALLWDEDSKTYLAFCPALDVSSYGKTIADTKRAFNDAIDIFMQETIKRGTLHQYLLAKGWMYSTKRTPEYKVPSVNLRKFDKDYEFRSHFTPNISIPAPSVFV